MDNLIAFKRNLFPINKGQYVHGKKPNVRCILCAIQKGNKKVVNLTVYETEQTVVSLNLYPYSPGHLLLFSKRHITDITKMTTGEWLDMIDCIRSSVLALKKEYRPKGLNIGMNMGHPAGASIKHIHWHIVPRYRNETGFIDILTGAKIYIEHPKKTLARMKKAFGKLFPPVKKIPGNFKI